MSATIEKVVPVLVGWAAGRRLVEVLCRQEGKRALLEKEWRLPLGEGIRELAKVQERLASFGAEQIDEWVRKRYDSSVRAEITALRHGTDRAFGLFYAAEERCTLWMETGGGEDEAVVVSELTALKGAHPEASLLVHGISNWQMEFDVKGVELALDKGSQAVREKGIEVVKMGDYHVQVNWGGLEVMAYLSGGRPTLDGDPVRYHPQASTSNVLCLGSVMVAINEAAKHGRVWALSEMVEGLVRTYNPENKHKALEAWVYRSSCGHCGAFTDTEVTVCRDGRKYSQCPKCAAVSCEACREMISKAVEEGQESVEVQAAGACGVCRKTICETHEKYVRGCGCGRLVHKGCSPIEAGGLCSKCSKAICRACGAVCSSCGQAYCQECVGATFDSASRCSTCNPCYSRQKVGWRNGLGGVQVFDREKKEWRRVELWEIHPANPMYFWVGKAWTPAIPGNYNNTGLFYMGDGRWVPRAEYMQGAPWPELGMDSVANTALDESDEADEADEPDDNEGEEER